MTTNNPQLLGAAEAILFAAGEPLELERLGAALEIDPEHARELIDELAALIDRRDGGVVLVRMGDKAQLCTRPQHGDAVRAALELKHNQPLSSAAFEVLAVVAYHQPVTKSYIEQVRGVDCHHIISSLCRKRLLEERGRLDLPGRPLIYGTTDEFLKCFCLESLDELPPIPDVRTDEEPLLESPVDDQMNTE